MNVIFAAIKNLEVHMVYSKTEFVFYSPCSLKFVISKIVGGEGYYIMLCR